MSLGDMSVDYSYQVAYAHIPSFAPAGFLVSVGAFLGVAKQLLIFPLLPDEIDCGTDNFVQCLLFAAPMD